MNTQKGFTIIAASLALDSDHTWMMAKPDERLVMLHKHPFDPTYDGLVDFYGYGSDDIYPFLKRACTPSKFDVAEARFILYLVDVFGDGKYDVWAEIKNEYSAVLVKGMTNYSGSGGDAYDQMKAALGFLAELYGKEVEHQKITSVLDAVAQRMIETARKEQASEPQDY